MIDLFLASLTIAYILLVWLQTDAIEEYIRVIPFLRKLLLSKYESAHDTRKVDTGACEYANLREYLDYKHGNLFIVKLILCPICLSFWLSIPIILILGIKFWIPVAFLANLLYFYLSNLIKHLHS